MKIKIQVLTNKYKFFGQLVKNVLYWETLEVEVTEDDTVEEVKKKIGDAGGWDDLGEEPLILGSDYLRDDIKMVDAGVEEGSVLVCGAMEVVITMEWESPDAGFPLVKMVGFFVMPWDTVGGLVEKIKAREKFGGEVKVTLKHGDEKLDEEKTLTEYKIVPDTVLKLEFV